MAELLLNVRNLHAGYGRAEVLHGLTLTARAGKSTLLNALMGALPAKGTIEYDGKSVTLLSLEERVLLGMALVPETRALFGAMSVEDNLLLGAWRQFRLGKARAPRQRSTAADPPGGSNPARDGPALGFDSAKELNSVYMLFPRLRERRTQLAGTLSGGERQMLAVGRALMGKPALLMLDEPSLGLAPLVVKEIFRIIDGLRATGVTILLVEQNARAALEVADYGYVLEMGEVALQGPAEDLARDPRVIETYLGAARKKTEA